MCFESQRVSAALASGVNPGRNSAAGNSNPRAAVEHIAEDMTEGVTEDTAEDMAKALGAGWLELWYQPKIGSQILDLRGAEALVRMRHPRLGVLKPAAFARVRQPGQVAQARDLG